MAVDHTPGPWFVDSQNGQCVVAGDDNGPIVAMCMAEDLGDGMAFGNARLIAIAPDFLSFVEEIVPFLHNVEHVERAKALIALAAPGPKGGGA